MINYFSYLLEASMTLLILYGFYLLVLRLKGSPRFNRFFLLFSLLFSLALPFISIPTLYFPGGSNATTFLSITEYWNFLPELVITGTKEETPEPNGALSLNRMGITGYFYLTGLLTCLTLTIRKIGKLWKLIRQFHFQEKEGGLYKLTHTQGAFPTFSFLHFIFLDNTVPLNQSEKQQILHHEIAHVRQKHTLDLLLLEFIRALLWFNPLLWFYRKSLMQVHEHLADRYAVERSEKSSYLQLMVKQTLHQANIPLASLFFQHNTLNRIHMLHTTPKHPIFKAILGSVLMLSLIFVAACEDEPTPQSPDNTGQLNQMKKSAPQAVQIESTEEVYEQVEEYPQPLNGMEALYTTLGENLKYPEEAASKGIEGRVYVQFVVEKSGSITEVKTVKGVGSGLDLAAEKAALATSGLWIPGKNNGESVRTRMILPINFRL